MESNGEHRPRPLRLWSDFSTGPLNSQSCCDSEVQKDEYHFARGGKVRLVAIGWTSITACTSAVLVASVFVRNPSNFAYFRTGVRVRCGLWGAKTTVAVGPLNFLISWWRFSTVHAPPLAPRVYEGDSRVHEGDVQERARCAANLLRGFFVPLCLHLVRPFLLPPPSLQREKTNPALTVNLTSNENRQKWSVAQPFGGWKT